MAKRTPPTSIFAQRAEREHGAHGEGMFDRYVVSMTVAGEVIYDVDGSPFRVPAGDMVLVHPGTNQHWQVVSEQPWETMYCIFVPQPHWTELLRLPEVSPGYSRVTAEQAHDLQQIGDLFCALIRSMQQPRPMQIDFDRNLVERILIWLSALHESQATPLDHRVAGALSHIAQNLGQPLSLDGLAEASSSSRSRIASLFRQQVGMTPMAYVEQQRMRRAMQLLRYTTEPIGAIARQVGFEDPHYFANRFRRFAGQSPSGYRKGG